jgi:ABC-type transport system involved in multi-copper enzyme maturation permease subunit
MLGPHFYYDLIRIARTGRTTLLRCLYLLALLFGVWVVYQVPTGGTDSRNAYAQKAQNIAVTVIVLQYIMVIGLTPVYACGAIIEEKQRRTLELLFTTQLTDREIVLGKLGARIAHLAMIVLASSPLLVFVQLWGGIDLDLVTFHYVHALLLAVFVGAFCMWMSAECASLLEALVVSYAILPGLGYAVAFVAIVLPEIAVPGTLTYWIPYLVMTPCYLGGAAWISWFAIIRVALLRRAWIARGRVPHGRSWKRRLPQLHQPPAPRDRKIGAERPRRAVHHLSRIHPLAWPIEGHALFWKECLKDGDQLSLTYRWLWLPAVAVPLLAFTYLSLVSVIHAGPFHEHPLMPFAYFGTFATYFIGLGTYVVWSLVRVTGSVAREREMNTLDFLLLVPVERAEVLFCKWLGALWRPWPWLALAYSGVLLGLVCGLYRPHTAVLLVVLPWPLLLMLSFLGLLLSVWCHRVLSANLGMASVLVAIFIGHLLFYEEFGLLLQVYAATAFDLDPRRMADRDWSRGLELALLEQASFMWLAVVFVGTAFWLFQNRRSS